MLAVECDMPTASRDVTHKNIWCWCLTQTCVLATISGTPLCIFCYPTLELTGEHSSALESVSSSWHSSIHTRMMRMYGSCRVWESRCWTPPWQVVIADSVLASWSYWGKMELRSHSSGEQKSKSKVSVRLGAEPLAVSYSFQLQLDTYSGHGLAATFPFRSCPLSLKISASSYENTGHVVLGSIYELTSVFLTISAKSINKGHSHRC